MPKDHPMAQTHTLNAIAVFVACPGVHCIRVGIVQKQRARSSNFRDVLTKSQERVDDAVRRILRVKFELGLFENPYGDPSLVKTVGSEEHRALARQAVRESLVLLKNDNNALPVDKNASTILVAGDGASNIGMQAGGWTSGRSSRNSRAPIAPIPTCSSISGRTKTAKTSSSTR
jgi:beta-glucosidase